MSNIVNWTLNLMWLSIYSLRSRIVKGRYWTNIHWCIYWIQTRIKFGDRFFTFWFCHIGFGYSCHFHILRLWCGLNHNSWLWLSLGMDYLWCGLSNNSWLWLSLGMDYLWLSLGMDYLWLSLGMDYLWLSLGMDYLWCGLSNNSWLCYHSWLGLSMDYSSCWLSSYCWTDRSCWLSNYSWTNCGCWLCYHRWTNRGCTWRWMNHSWWLLSLSSNHISMSCNSRIMNYWCSLRNHIKVVSMWSNYSPSLGDHINMIPVLYKASVIHLFKRVINYNK